MRSLLLSAVLALSSLGLLLADTPSVEAQWRARGRGSVGVYVAPSGTYGYTRGGYYGGYYRPRYYSGYYYPRYYTYPSYSSSYYSDSGSYSGSQYDYYWSNGWYICYDRSTGEYWYQDPSSGTWYLWT